MPFCPKCRTEYRHGFTICSDCDAYLIAVLPPEEKEEDLSGETQDYKNWIALVRLTSPQYANMIVEILRDKNIPVVIHSGAGHFGKLDQLGISSFRPVGGAYSIMVPRKFIIDANNEGEAILGDIWIDSRLIDISEFK
jgi:hypothetical protein